MSFFSILSKIPGMRKPLYNLLYSHVARKQRSEFRLELKNLKQFKDCHKGEDCFIIGTGPSLRVEDLQALTKVGFITFAPNRIYEICEKSGWQPTYYICQDHLIIDKFTDRIRRIKCKNGFLPVEHKTDFQDLDNYNFFVLQEKDFYPGDADFSRDFSHYVAQGYTVTYGAIQLAAYMGFKTIYLLGIDHNYTIIRDANGRPVKQQATKQDYPDSMTQFITTQNLPRTEESTIAYETAEKLSQALGIKIINATRGGKLEAFERADFDEIIKNKTQK